MEGIAKARPSICRHHTPTHTSSSPYSVPRIRINCMHAKLLMQLQAVSTPTSREFTRAKRARVSRIGNLMSWSFVRTLQNQHWPHRTSIKRAREPPAHTQFAAIYFSLRTASACAALIEPTKRVRACVCGLVCLRNLVRQFDVDGRAQNVKYAKIARDRNIWDTAHSLRCVMSRRYRNLKR